MLRDYRDVPREAMYLAYASFLPSMAIGMFYVDVSYFLTTVQGLPDILMGTVIMVMGISAVATSIPLGMAADRYGRRKSLVAGNILASSSIMIFALTTNFAILLLSAIVGGVSEAAFSASYNALMAEKAGNENRTSAFSLSAFVSSIGYGLGSFAIPLTLIFQSLGVTDKSSHVVLYVLLGFLSLVSTFLMLKVTESRHIRTSDQRHLLPRKSMGVIVRYVASSSIVAFGAGMFVPLMARWLYLRYDVSDAVSGPILGISSFLIAFATLSAPALAKKWGTVRAIVITQGISTFFMFATPFCPDHLVAAFVYTVRSFLMNMSNPLSQSLIMGLVAEDERGAASGISAAIWRLPHSISSSVGAGLMGAGRLGAPFYIATALYVVSITIFWFAFGKMSLPAVTATRVE